MLYYNLIKNYCVINSNKQLYIDILIIANLLIYLDMN